MTRKNRDMVGSEFTNRFGDRCKIIEYNHSKDLRVVFDNGYTCSKTLTHLRSGKFTYPFTKTCYGVGFLGVGEYKSSGVAKCVARGRWRAMLGRVYSDRESVRLGDGLECDVHPDWHNFQTYAEWFYNTPTSNLLWEVDKDLRVIGNRTYSENTCSFVPPAINSFLPKKLKNNGLPIGVSWLESNQEYVVSGSAGGGVDVWYGGYDSPEQAFLCYKRLKEKRAKELAVEYRGRIHEDVFCNLMNFVIDIDFGYTDQGVKE